MRRIYKSRIYYVLNYDNRIKGIPFIILGIRLPVFAVRGGGGISEVITLPPLKE
jgi:hypothetical protein